jgi:hypothetical protein
MLGFYGYVRIAGLVIVAQDCNQSHWRGRWGERKGAVGAMGAMTRGEIGYEGAAYPIRRIGQ